MFWNVFGFGTILPAHANLRFHFYLVNMHRLFYQQKICTLPHYFRLTLWCIQNPDETVYMKPTT